MANQNNTRVKVPNKSPGANTDFLKSYDDVPPNPQGRDKSDQGASKRRNFTSCKTTVTVSTMNVRTIREQRCKEELVSNSVSYKIDVLGIQEHRIVHSEPIGYESIQGRTLITTSATRNTAGAAIGGIGVLLSPKAYRSLSSVKSHTPLILIANFHGNPKTTVIVTYCPTNVTDEDITEAHYDSLKGAIDSIPAHNMLMIVGDFNARIGHEDSNYSFHESTNRNGKYLVELAMEKSLMITNTHFRKKDGKLWTYISPGGCKYQLDYILIRRKWKNSVLNAEAYNTFASVGSDHRIISAKIRLSLRKAKNIQRKKQYNWKMLSSDTTLQSQYTIKVCNKFQPLQDIEESATEEYARFIKANEEATKEVIPVLKTVRKANVSNDPRVNKARDNIKEAYSLYEQDISEESRLTYKETKTKLGEAYNLVTEEDLGKKLKEVETAHANCKHGLSWKLINDITGRKASKKGQLMGDTQKERVKNWYNHFKNLLGSPPTIEDEDEDIPIILEGIKIKEGPFDHEEYQKAKKSLVEGKSCGEDGIPPEVLKNCDLDDIILKFCNNALLDGQMPDQWSILNIVPIPKSGDLRLGGNYRGISLSSIVAKTFNRLILNRIRPEIDEHLRNNQNGFRVKRTTVGHILALRRLIEGIKAYNLSAIITFIDFKKAFDTIHRGKMLKILTAYGVPNQLVNAIAKTYENTRAKVISPDGETDLFQILAGVLQGDTLAPYLFVIVLDYALRKAIDGQEEPLGFHLEKRKTRRVGPVTATDFDFADDIALLSEEIDQAQILLNRVETHVAKVGLKLNAGKTKYMSFNQDHATEIKTNDDTSLDKVTDFKYLGAWMESTEKDIKTRKAAAWRACNQLSKIWKSSLQSKFKMRLFSATVESVLLYGCEAWTVTPKLEKQLNGCYTRLLRTVHNVHWSKHMTNQELYSGQPKISDKIKKRRLRFAGHCYRSKHESVSKLVLWTPKHGRRKPGRPALTYIDILKRDTGLPPDDIKTAMQDRSVWRAIVDRGQHST
jgi:hypothetical protein